MTNAYVDFGPGGTIANTNYATVGQLRLPAGNWVMTATVDLVFSGSDGATADSINCEPVAECLVGGDHRGAGEQPPHQFQLIAAMPVRPPGPA